MHTHNEAHCYNAQFAARNSVGSLVHKAAGSKAPSRPHPSPHLGFPDIPAAEFRASRFHAMAASLFVRTHACIRPACCLGQPWYDQSPVGRICWRNFPTEKKDPELAEVLPRWPPARPPGRPAARPPSGHQRRWRRRLAHAPYGLSVIKAGGTQVVPFCLEWAVHSKKKGSEYSGLSPQRKAPLNPHSERRLRKTAMPIFQKPLTQSLTRQTGCRCLSCRAAPQQ